MEGERGGMKGCTEEWRVELCDKSSVFRVTLNDNRSEENRRV